MQQFLETDSIFYTRSILYWPTETWHCIHLSQSNGLGPVTRGVSYRSGCALARRPIPII